MPLRKILLAFLLVPTLFLCADEPPALKGHWSRLAQDGGSSAGLATYQKKGTLDEILLDSGKSVYWLDLRHDVVRMMDGRLPIEADFDLDRPLAPAPKGVCVTLTPIFSTPKTFGGAVYLGWYATLRDPAIDTNISQTTRIVRFDEDEQGAPPRHARSIGDCREPLKPKRPAPPR